MSTVGSLVNLIATETPGGSLQPSTKNRFKMRFSSASARQLSFYLNKHNPGTNYTSTPYTDQKLNDTHASPDLVNFFLNYIEKYPLEVSFQPPSINVAEAYVYRKNIHTKYGEYTNMGEASLTLNNFTTVHTSMFFYLWCAMCGGMSRNPDSWEMQQANIISSSASMLNKVIPAAYKAQIDVIQYNTVQAPIYNHPYKSYINGDSPELYWKLYGTWPKSVKIDNYDNSNDGDMVQTHVTFSVDWCMPLFDTSQS